jgi:hypothetical protein
MPYRRLRHALLMHSRTEATSNRSDRVTDHFRSTAAASAGSACTLINSQLAIRRIEP